MADQVTPDTLMERFQGKGLKGIILFTIVVHVVVIGGSSVPYLVRDVFGADTSEMTEDERIKAAVQEATAAIRDIAADYGLNPQDISDQFASGGSRAAAVSGTAPEPEEDAITDEPEPDRPKSQIEKDIEVTAEGPAVPTIEDDIF